MIDTTIDAALGGKLRLRQPAKGYRFAIDPILLAASCPARGGDRVVELGCGIGIASLALARRTDGVWCVGIDKIASLVEIANGNAASNGLSDRVKFAVGDVRRWNETLEAGAADFIIANPPYLAGTSMTVSSDPIKAAATAEDDGGIEAWVKAAAGCLRRGGGAIIIHRSERLGDLLTPMGKWFGGLVVLPIHSRKGALAKRIVVLARKGSRRPLRLLPGMVLHSAQGTWTAQANAILRGKLGMELEKLADTGAGSRHGKDD